jgi:hypothetical protein
MQPPFEHPQDAYRGCRVKGLALAPTLLTDREEHCSNEEGRKPDRDYLPSHSIAKIAAIERRAELGQSTALSSIARHIAVPAEPMAV